MSLPAIIFDLDGTLIDSAPAIHAVCNLELGVRGLPLLPLEQAHPFLLWPDRDWLAGRIDARFGQMLEDGALDEVRAVLPIWDPAALWAKAIGAPELVAHLRGDLPLDVARLQAQAASRQYAKRQRTWFRRRMRDWTTIALP